MVTYDGTTGDATTIGIDSGGTLAFQNDRATKLQVGTLLVMPGGTLEVGTEQDPIAANINAEIIIKNTPLNSTIDPSQYGTALLALGDVIIHGSVKSPTFVRVSAEPKAGQTTLSLDEPVSGWRPGDRLILPDTRHLRDNEVRDWQALQNQWEELTLQSISGDGKTITLTSALRFDHLGARDGNGKLDFLPHVGNLSRNVVIRSQSPIGSAGIKGHTLFTQRARINVRYALFKDLGRTLAAPTGSGNQIGRYPVHMHHLIGPATTPANGYQYTLIGNAVDGGSSVHNLRWGMAVHNSHYGLIKDNVAYNYNGYLIGTEDGSESYNVFDHNLTVRSNGSGGRLGEGNEGGGFWFRGPNNYIRNNVAANLMSNGPDAAYGFKFAQFYLGKIDIPQFKGADTSVTGQYTTVDGHSLPVLEFSDNEVYGATGSGFAYWWVGTFGNGYPRATKDTIFKNLRIWHVFNRAIFPYEAMRIIHDGLVIRGKDPANGPACCGVGISDTDYTANNITWRNVDIQGMGSGFGASTVTDGGLQIIENSYFRNLSNFWESTLCTSAADASWIPPRKVIIRNTRFEAWPGRQFDAISMDWNPNRNCTTNTTQRDELLVYSYQGNPNDNFQVYYTEQATQNIAGGRAPCTATRPEINGLVCPIAAPPGGGTPAPLAAPTNVQVSN
jgi:hypothetical protein